MDFQASPNKKSDSSSFNVINKQTLDFFQQLQLKNSDYAQHLIVSLMHLIDSSKETTMQGLTNQIKSAGEHIIDNAKQGVSKLVLRSTQTIYLHYMSKGLMHSGGDNMLELKVSLMHISQELLDIMTASKQKIVQNSLTFLRNRTKVLIFGSSNVILHVLNEAYKRKIDLEVYIPECKGTNEGIDFYKKLSKIGFTCKLIYDSTIGYCLEECDMVLVGAEAVVENGGIINRAGTYTTALCCKILKKPFYVLAESFKFARLFPLSQKDLTDNIQDQSRLPKFDLSDEQLEYYIPQCDYTPPEMITLLFTDVGIFTPSAVSEELIKIFNT